jgi:hypothetical protein
MKTSSLAVDRKLKTATIVMPLETARPSKSGKTMLIATTKGLRTSTEQYARRPVFFTGNAFFYAANSVNSNSDNVDSNGTNDDLSRARDSGRKNSGSHNKFKKEKS